MAYMILNRCGGAWALEKSGLVGKLVSGPTQGSSRSSGPGGPAHPSCSNDTPDPINISYHSDRLFMPCYTLHMLFI